MVDNNKMDETGIKNASASNRIKTKRKTPIETSSDTVKRTASKSKRTTTNRRITEKSISASNASDINLSDNIHPELPSISSPNTPRKSAIQKTKKSEKKLQKTLFEGIQGDEGQHAPMKKTQIISKGSDKSHKEKSYLIDGQELKSFANITANILDGAVIAAIDFLENTPKEYARDAARNLYIREIEDIIDFKKHPKEAGFKNLSHENIKDIIREIIVDASGKNFTKNISITDDQSIYNDEDEFSVYAQIISKSLACCCLIIIDRLDVQEVSVDNEKSAKQKLYSAFIKQLQMNIDANSLTRTSIVEMLETECLSLVSGLIGFADDIISISSKMQFRFNENNSIEYNISKISFGGKADWSSQIKNIFSYDKSMKINDHKSEISEEIVHIEETNNITDHIIGGNLSGIKDSNTEYEPIAVNEDVIAQNGRVKPIEDRDLIFPDVQDNNNIFVDKPSHLVSGFESNRDELHKRSALIRKVIIFMSLLGVFIATTQYYYRSQIAKHENKIVVHNNIMENLPRYIDQTNIEKYIFSRPEIGKVMILYKDYFPSDYIKLINYIVSRKILVGSERAEQDAISQIIQDIDLKLTGASNRISLAEMDEIIYYEIILVGKLADAKHDVCNFFLPQRNYTLLEPGYINAYLSDIASILIAELEAIQKAAISPEIAIDMTSTDWKELEEIYKLHQIDGINIAGLMIALRRENLPRKAVSCKEVIGLLSLISGTQENLRFKLSRQVLFK